MVDEPFYAAYLAATGLDHPMREAVIASQSSDPEVVAGRCVGSIPQEQSLFYQKHMTLHMIPQFPRDFMRQLSNVFLIRHPARVIASYAKKREGPQLADIGYVQQAELFDQVADWLGHAPLVIDCADIPVNPEAALRGLCQALGIDFLPQMLPWPVGSKLHDGIWAPHWNGAVHRSTGFEDPEAALPNLEPSYRNLVEQALPLYERLATYKL